MRYVSSFPPRLSIVDDLDVKGVAGIRPMQSVLVRSYPVSESEQYKRYERHQQTHPMGDQSEPGRRTVSPKDRRKASLRVSQQKMLVEFRSGRNRRRHNQRRSDIVEHIDEKA